MAHDSFEEDIELANGHPVGSYRNDQNMAHDKPFITDASREAIKRGEDKACSPSWRETRNEPNMTERTLTARVAELERVQAEHDRRIAALERKVEP